MAWDQGPKVRSMAPRRSSSRREFLARDFLERADRTFRKLGDPRSRKTCAKTNDQRFDRARWHRHENAVSMRYSSPMDFMPNHLVTSENSGHIPMVRGSLKPSWAEMFLDADLAAVRIISRTAKSTVGRASAIVISKLGNGWLYLILGAIIFEWLGSAGFRVVVLAGLNAILLHCLFPHIKRRIGRPRPFRSRSAPSVVAGGSRRAFISQRTRNDLVRGARADCAGLAGHRHLGGDADVIYGVVPDRDGPSLSQRRRRGRVLGHHPSLSSLHLFSRYLVIERADESLLVGAMFARIICATNARRDECPPNALSFERQIAPWSACARTSFNRIERCEASPPLA